MQDLIYDTQDKVINGKALNVINININNKTIELVKFGNIAEVRQGLATADNDYYVYQNPQASNTNYKDIRDYQKYILSDSDLKKILSDDEVKQKIKEKGIHKARNEQDFDEDLWFNGRYILPYDKGGESDVGTGWLPNYYVPTNYYIDWCKESVERLKTLTVRQRNRLNGKEGGSNKVCSRFQNKDF